MSLLNFIYDVFYNDVNQLIIIMPSETKEETIYYIYPDNKCVPFYLHKCPHNHTFIYTIPVTFTDTVRLLLKNQLVTVPVKKYPQFKDEIIFSTIVKNEDKYIKQWIDFHLKIGVARFIIYDNSNENTLSEVLKNYIINNQVVLIKWNYPYILPVSGISGQTTQQNHSIYAFKTSKFIGLFDIDEYVNIQRESGFSDINSFLQNITVKNKININNVGSFRLLNKNFYNPDNLSTDGNDFLKITTCDKITLEGREKNFVIPKNVNTFSVHMITDGKQMVTLNHACIYFNHYIFLNKDGNRGCHERTPYIDDSILY